MPKALRSSLLALTFLPLLACDDQPLTDPPTEEEVEFCEESTIYGSVMYECEDYLAWHEHWEGHEYDNQSYELDDCNPDGIANDFDVSGYRYMTSAGAAIWVDYSTSPPVIRFVELGFNYFGYNELPNPARETGAFEGDEFVKEGAFFNHGEGVSSNYYSVCNYYGDGELTPLLDGSWAGTITVQSPSGRDRQNYESDRDYFENSSGRWCHFEPIDVEVTIPSSLDLDAGVDGWELPSGTSQWEDDELPCLGTEMTWRNPETGWEGIIQFNWSHADMDHDGVSDWLDNCPEVYNPREHPGATMFRYAYNGPDNDEDGQGDACDPDDDNDEILDEEDLCPFTFGEDNGDDDGDGIGNACDSDADNDGIENEDDLCPLVASEDNEDADGDGIGNPCDDDSDNDGLTDDEDLCPLLASEDNGDSDGDGLGDPCDNDSDNDGVSDDEDNCPDVPNAGQEDADYDRLGTACDPGEVPGNTGSGYCLGELTYMGSVHTNGGCSGDLELEVTMWADGGMDGVINLVPHQAAACFAVQDVPVTGQIHEAWNGDREMILNGVLEGIGGPGVDLEATFTGTLSPTCISADGTLHIPQLRDSGTWDLMCMH